MLQFIYTMIVLPKNTDLKNLLKSFATENKIELAIIGYFFLLEIFFLGGYYYSLQKLPSMV